MPVARSEDVIERHWNGWTTAANADAYEQLLTEEILPGFADDLGDGFRGYRVLRRSADEADLVEFRTVLRFDDLETVIEFAGEDYERAHVPPAARELLARYDEEARHFEIRGESGE